MAILYGTQSNGETLPVLVDQFGNLLAKGIEGPAGSIGPEGPEGPEGPPGTGVPEPIGAEGQYLQVVNGEPAWAAGPPDPTISQVSLVNADALEYSDSSGFVVTPANPYASAEALPSWNNVDVENKEGLIYPTVEAAGGRLNLVFRTWLGADKIIKLYFQTYSQSLKSSGDQNVEYNHTLSGTGFSLLDQRVNPTKILSVKQGTEYWLQHEYWIESTEQSAEFTFNCFAGFIAYGTRFGTRYRGATIESMGRVAYENQKALTAQIKELRAEQARAANS